MAPIHAPPPISFCPRLNHIAPQLARISSAPVYLMGKEFMRSVVGGLNRPRPVILVKMERPTTISQ